MRAGPRAILPTLPPCPLAIPSADGSPAHPVGACGGRRGTRRPTQLAAASGTADGSRHSRGDRQPEGVRRGGSSGAQERGVIQFHIPPTAGVGVLYPEDAKQLRAFVGRSKTSASPSQTAKKNAIARRDTIKRKSRDTGRRARVPARAKILKTGMASGAQRQTNVPAVASWRLRLRATPHIPRRGQVPWRGPGSRTPKSQSSTESVYKKDPPARQSTVTPFQQKNKKKHIGDRRDLHGRPQVGGKWCGGGKERRGDHGATLQGDMVEKVPSREQRGAWRRSAGDDENVDNVSPVRADEEPPQPPFQLPLPPRQEGEENDRRPP